MPLARARRRRNRPRATPAVPAPSGPAAALAKRLGLPNRLLIGLGSGGADTSLINAQGLKPDFYERYLVGIDSQGGWTTWNSPTPAAPLTTRRPRASEPANRRWPRHRCALRRAGLDVGEPPAGACWPNAKSGGFGPRPENQRGLGCLIEGSQDPARLTSL